MIAKTVFHSVSNNDMIMITGNLLC